MAKYTGADIIVEHLIGEGVPYLFGLTGHGIIGLLEALHGREDKLKVVSVHHEAVAGFMADAYFRVSHRPVATFSSCGPGSANMVIALANAMMDSSAFLAITGNVPTTQFNRAPFQESGYYFQADFPSVIRTYVKRSFQPTRVEMLPLTLRQAFSVMTSGRYGPVNLDVPFDVFQEGMNLDAPVAPSKSSRGARPAQADAEAVSNAVDLLLSARRPLILAGKGALLSEASDPLAELASTLDIPVVTTPDGKGVIDERHHLSLGACGRNGTLPATQAARCCDVLLALGASFDDRATSSWLPGVTFAIPPTKLIQVDVAPEEIGRNYDVEIGIVGNEKAVIGQLLREAGARLSERAPAQGQWLEDIKTWKTEWFDHLRGQASSEAVPIRPQRLVRDLRAALPANAIVLCDVGVHHNWLIQNFEAYGPQNLVATWGFGAMGFGVCGVLGAKLAAPDRPCVCVCGDGGFLMASHAVATAVEYDIPVVWIVWNNYGYVSIGDLQLGAFGREIAAAFTRQATGEFLSPDFAMLAQAYGAQGLRVERPSDFGPALEAALNAGVPYVLDVCVDRETRPLGTGGWELPPLPPFMPNFPKPA